MATPENDRVFRYFTENVTDIVWRMDANEQFTYVNPSVTTLLGYSVDEVLGKTTRDLVTPESYEKVAKIITKELAKSNKKQKDLTRSLKLEVELIHKNGSKLRAEVKLIIECDRSGQPKEFFGVISNVTKYYQAMPEQEKTTMFEVINAMVDAVLIFDLNGVVIAGNHSIFRMFGVPAEKLIGKTIMELPGIEKQKEEEIEKFMPLFQEAIKNGSYGPVELTIVNHIDKEIPMSIAGGTINGPSYKPMFVVVVLRDISNRKQTEKALQESEKKCRTIFENASDGIMLVDIENKKFHMGNKTIHKMLGYTPKEIKNITIFDIHPKDEMPEILKQFERQLRKEITLAKDIPIKRKDGSIFYADINSTPIKLAGKDYLLGIFRDITERKQNEELLRQKEELNQSLLDSIPFYAMLISKDKTVLAANKISQKAGAKINGFCWRDFGQSEFIHEEDKEYIDKNKKIPPDGTNCYFCLAEEAMEKQEPTQNEVEAWGKIWDTHWIPIDNNKFIHYAIDITEHKRAREALYESEDRFRDLAELLPETIFITDKEGTITFVNQAGREKFGYTEKDFKKGINVLHALVPKDRDRAQENIAMLTYDKAGQGTEYTALRKDGSTFPVIVYANPVTRDGKLAGMRGILVDNSERKRVEMGLKWESDINRALVELSSTIELTQTPIENVAEIVLWYSISLTNSEFGIVSEIDPKTGEIIGYKPKMMNIGSASKQFKKATFPKGPDGKYIGLWGEAFRIQKGFYTNSPKTHEATRKFPEMHLHLNNFLSVPVIVADKVVGQIAIANSANEYTEKDLNAVKQIAYLYAVAIDRNRSESALRESEENLAKAQEIAHVGSWDWDIATNKLHWSDEMYRIFDIKSTSEPTLEMVQERIHPEDRKIFKKAMTKPKKSKSPESIEHRIIKSNGKVRSLQTRSELFFNNHGDIIRMMGTMQDITELKHVEEQLERALSEETLLFRELKHRVNNNLQLLISMVNMWVMETEVAAVREALSEVAGVISTMALVHTEAQVDPSAKGIRLKEFMRELTKSIIGFKTHGNLEVTYSIDGDDVWIEIEQANPLSLVANEILINALKHAFNRKKKGHIAVSLKENDGKVKLSIKDDGIGISPEVDIMKGDSLGMELVQNLVEQLHGNMNIEVDNGTNIIIEFPKGG